VLVKGTILAYGPTVETFTQDNLERAFGGVLRHFVLNQAQNGKPTPVSVYSDDERPLILKDGKVASHSFVAAGASKR
ncbi:manganese/iron transporter ATP-binding protein, partial [Candidatus Entotheonella serta]